MPKVPQEDSYFIRKLYEVINVSLPFMQENDSKSIEWDGEGRAFIVNE